MTAHAIHPTGVKLEPAVKSRLKKLISAGMDVARLNFSHGTHKEHEEVIKNIRTVAKEMNKAIAILGDLQGPKIRTGTLMGGKPVLLKRNKLITITTKNIHVKGQKMPLAKKVLEQPLFSGFDGEHLGLVDNLILDLLLIEREEKKQKSVICTLIVIESS